MGGHVPVNQMHHKPLGREPWAGKASLCCNMSLLLVFQGRRGQSWVVICHIPTQTNPEVCLPARLGGTGAWCGCLYEPVPVQ